MSKFGVKVPHLRCDSYTSFKVKRSKVRVTDGRGIPCRPNPPATLLVKHSTSSSLNDSDFAIVVYEYTILDKESSRICDYLHSVLTTAYRSNLF